MGIVIESEFWEPNPSLYIFIFISCVLSIALLPQFSKRTSTSSSPFDASVSSSSFSFLPFQRKFLLLYSLASVLEGFWAVFGDYEMVNHGVSREQMVLSLIAGCLASLFVGTFFGMLSDVIGQRKVCFLFCILHLVVGTWKMVASHPAIWLASTCLSLATSIFSFSFETWMVVEHEKLGYRQDALNDTFWLMTFSESAALIGSQMLANWLVGDGFGKTLVSPSTVSVFLAVINIMFISRGLTESSAKRGLKSYTTSLLAYFYSDRQVLLLACAQACLYFSVSVFWILWAPTVVADGREVHLGLIYPCLMGARMLGSSAFSWFNSGMTSLRTADYLVCAYVISGFVLFIVAYDYQEIGVLVTLFCIFHACFGLISPSLSRLRTMYVPNEFRAGMISVSLAPANAMILLILFQGGYYRNIYNATITAFAAVGLFLAAGCMYMLKRWGKQPHQIWHKLGHKDHS